MRKVRDKLTGLSTDAETRRLAFVRERALLDEAVVATLRGKRD